VYGPDVMEAVLARGGGLRQYLLGGSEQTLVALRAEIARRWPNSVVVGAESPPFRPLSDSQRQEQDARIAESGAQLVWVGLGTPKQDWEAARLARSLPVVALAVGAAFDFLAGTKAQAPVWVQRCGIEWAYRLAHEPRRLARRYFWGNPRFLLAAARTPGLRRGSGAPTRR
jgi:N-acetylglucosaminyldiphosphoundecaprenol N-acetyl-beta-D-mannosaminyltransferase